MRKLALVLVAGLVALVAMLAVNLGGNEVRGAPGDQQRVITVNDLFSDVAKAAPAFGGMFYDEQGDLNVYLLDTGKKEPAQAAITAVFGAERVPRGGIRVLPARYSFPDLRTWHDQAVSLFAIPGVLSSGIDHKANVLEVGVQDLRISDDVRRALQNLDIPQGAVRIKQTEPIVLQETLRDKVRPVKGGLNIDAQNCTLGYNARLGSVEGFVTASHCSPPMGVVDGQPFYQTALVPADLIGSETVDPPFFLGLGPPGPCPLGWFCRWSDAAFAQYANGVNFARGFIEKTQTVNAPQNPTNVTVAGQFKITATGVAVAGNTVNKVGRSSGWTQGLVWDPCVDENMGTYIMLCQTQVSYQSAGGDSGAPVFMIPSPGSDNVTLVGNHWGGLGDAGECPAGCTDEGKHMTTMGIFSPFGQVVGELGLLTVTAPPVGGMQALPDTAQSALETAEPSHGSSPPYAAIAGAAAGSALLLAAGGWYARRRWRKA